MSEETKAALDEAISAQVDSEERGAITTGWVLAAAAMPTEFPDRDVDTNHVYCVPEAASGQPLHSGLGLAYQLVDHYRIV